MKSLEEQLTYNRKFFVSRFLSKGLDFFLILVFHLVLPYPLGPLLGILSILFGDAMKEGRSVGKLIFHLKTLDSVSKKSCSVQQSVIRNLPLGIVAFFGILPIWGWLLMIFIGTPILFIESYLIYKNGQRLGDLMAETEVSF